jgi:hypothetical protein
MVAVSWEEGSMIQTALIKKLLCVAVVVTALLPLGWMIYPEVETVLSDLQFNTLEAMLGATLGLGLYSSLFG